MHIAADFFSDACYQALAYWIMSALTNDPFKLARYTGLYKAFQAAVCHLTSRAAMGRPLTLSTTAGRGSELQHGRRRDAIPE